MKGKNTHAMGEKCATALLTEMQVGNAMPADATRESLQFDLFLFKTKVRDAPRVILTPLTGLE